MWENGFTKPLPEEQFLHHARAEHLTYFAGKLRCAEGLRKIRDAPPTDAPAGNRISTISGHIQHAAGGTHGLDLVRQFRSRHSWHHNISHKQVDGAGMRARELQRAQAVTTTQHLITASQQHIAYDG